MELVWYIMWRPKWIPVWYIWQEQKLNKNTEEKEEEKTNKHAGRGVRVFLNVAELFPESARMARQKNKTKQNKNRWKKDDR